LFSENAEYPAETAKHSHPPFLVIPLTMQNKLSMQMAEKAQDEFISVNRIS
jgi:hypothetical protein